jgi:hypothetical protein
MALAGCRVLEAEEEAAEVLVHKNDKERYIRLHK